MIQIEEIRNEYNTAGTHPVVTKTAFELFKEWQVRNPDVEIMSVQKIENGLFITFQKKKEERIEKAVSNFGNKRK